MKKLAQCSALALGVLLSTTCLAEYMNPIAFPQTGDPTDVQVIVEIPYRHTHATTQMALDVDRHVNRLDILRKQIIRQRRSGFGKV